MTILTLLVLAVLPMQMVGSVPASTAFTLVADTPSNTPTHEATGYRLYYNGTAVADYAITDIVTGTSIQIQRPGLVAGTYILELSVMWRGTSPEITPASGESKSLPLTLTVTGTTTPPPTNRPTDPTNVRISWGAPPRLTEGNVALASNGATALGSSVNGSDYLAVHAIDGDLISRYWSDSTSSIYPDWLEVTFAYSYTINKIDVFSAADIEERETDPTPTQTGLNYVLQDFTLEHWTGQAWAVLATVTNNNLIWKTVQFEPVTTNKIRLVVTRAARRYSYTAEIRAWIAK